MIWATGIVEKQVHNRRDSNPGLRFRRSAFTTTQYVQCHENWMLFVADNIVKSKQMPPAQTLITAFRDITVFCAGGCGVGGAYFINFPNSSLLAAV